MKHCSNHCGACGSHFTSLFAFDAHRSGPFDGERVCWAERDEEVLRPATEDGTCDHRGFQPHITIWEHSKATDSARAYFGQRRASETELEAQLEEAA